MRILHVRAVPFDGQHSMYVLCDAQSGVRWWCGACGAASQGRNLPVQRDPQGAEREATRLAEAHIRRHHRSSGG